MTFWNPIAVNEVGNTHLTESISKWHCFASPDDGATGTFQIQLDSLPMSLHHVSFYLEVYYRVNHLC